MTPRKSSAGHRGDEGRVAILRDEDAPPATQGDQLS